MPAATTRSVARPSDNWAHPLPDARSRLLDAARSYLEQGLVLTPIRASTTKAAYLPGWQRRRLSLAELAAELDRPGKGLGVVLGDPSGDLVDVDLDHPAAVEAADVLLPPTGLVSGRTGRPRTHRFYLAPGGRTRTFSSAATGMLVELRSTGFQTALPPSPHPAGRYRWDSTGDPGVVDSVVLLEGVGRVGAAAFLRVHGWSLAHAVAFARAPDLGRVAEWARRDDGGPPLARWLSLAHPPATPSRTPAQATSPASGGSASPFTQEVLARAGGVADVAAHFGLDLREGRQPCPWHDGRGGRALQVSGRLWRCHAGCGGGTAIHLVATILGTSYREARRALAALVGRVRQDAIPGRGAPARGGGGKRPTPGQPPTRRVALSEGARSAGAEPDARA